MSFIDIMAIMMYVGCTMYLFSYLKTKSGIKEIQDLVKTQGRTASFILLFLIIIMSPMYATAMILNSIDKRCK